MLDASDFKLSLFYHAKYCWRSWGNFENDFEMMKYITLEITLGMKDYISWIFASMQINSTAFTTFALIAEISICKLRDASWIFQISWFLSEHFLMTVASCYFVCLQMQDYAFIS